MQIVVHGAGIFGLSIAWACAQRGAQVCVVDPNGVGAGSSGGLVGALAPHVPENWNPKKQIQFESLVQAESFWSQVAQTGGQDPGYGRRGRVQPIADEHAFALAQGRSAGALTHWGGRYIWQVLDAAEAGIAVHSPTGKVVHDTLSARLHPRQACDALAAALKTLGVEFRTDDPGDGAVAIYATGVAGLLELNRLSETRLIGSGVKGQAALLACDMRHAPQLFAQGVHIVPHRDGTTAIGSTSEREYTDPASTDEQLDAVISVARMACPTLANAPVIERWAGVRPRVRSRAPILGAHPLVEGAYIANGGFKIGFGMAPIVATMMADLVLDGCDTIPISFRPEASLG